MRLSSLLSLHIRHAPEQLGLTLDAQGWTDVAALLAAALAIGGGLDHGSALGTDQIVAASQD